MDLTTLFILATVIVAFISGIVQIVKTTFNIATRFLPAVSIATGIFIGVILQPFSDYNMYTMIIAGFIAGLTAAGGFDLAKALKGVKQ